MSSGPDIVEIRDLVAVAERDPDVVTVGYTQLNVVVQEGGGTPSATVVAETSHGQAPSAGAAIAYSRGDHTHGTPALPTPAAIGASATGHAHTGVYDPAGTAAAAVTAHEAASDPHPQYLTGSEGNAAYSPLSHAHAAADIVSGTIAYPRLPVGTTSSTVAAGNDARLSDARTPLTHASSHASGGSDPVTPAAIGAAATGHAHTGVYDPAGTAAAAVTAHEVASDPHPQYLTGSEGNAAYSPLGHAHAGADITSGTVAYARLPVGTASSTVAAGNDSRITGALQAASNLSDVASAATARTNLAVPPTSRQVIAGAGLTGGGDLTTDRTLAVSYGSTSGTAAQGNDSRIVGAVQTSRQVLAGTGLTGGGDLSIDRTLSFGSGWWLPEDHGLVAWADDVIPTATVAPTAGTLYLIGMMVRRTIASGTRKGIIAITGAAVSPTASQNWMGLYNSSGTLQGSAADIGSATTSSGPLQATLGAFGLTAGLYWLAIIVNAGTPPTLARMSSITMINALANLNLSAAGLRWATNGTSLTSMPSSITPGSNVTTPNCFWGAIS
ncbi:hypothetical protein [Nonomuraea sediminis]|uniref:hypothetical protein n=1 Tax=Nonomuraea sediminis TaxID=2835864 RepID=UPI001BDD6441|nr:hypothetical protein [Nonomuraea sediminis]